MTENSTHITNDELEYHKKIVDDVGSVSHLRAEAQKRENAGEHWAEYLKFRYSLQEGDTIDLDGSINRQADKGDNN